MTRYARVRYQTNRFEEIGTGMHHLKDGQWVESTNSIELVEDGAIYRQGQYNVRFAPSIDTPGAIEIITPENQRIRLHTIGIAFTEVTTGRSAMIAVIRESIGVQTADNEILYPSCFSDDIDADLRYRITKNAFESDLVFRRGLPPPSAYGLEDAATRIELYHEFVEFPSPTARTSVIKSEPDPARRRMMDEPDLLDTHLIFGVFHFIPGGVAFSLGQDRLLDGIPVGKSWESRENRQLLIEKIDYSAAKPQFDQLPQFALNAAQAPNRIAKVIPRKDKAFLPPPLQAKAARGDIIRRMATLESPRKGYVMDYISVVTQTNMLFQGDTTYYVTATCNFVGTTTMEGGAVIKFTNSHNGANPMLKYLGPITCLATPGRPIICTSKDDNTYGEILPVSSGSVTQYAGRMHFDLLATNAYELSNLRLRYAKEAIHLNSGATLTLSHSQIGYGDRAIGFNVTGPEIRLRNVLIHDQVTALFITTTARVEHATFHRTRDFLTGGSAKAVHITNSLIMAVTNSVIFTGSNTETNLSDSGVFAAAIGHGSRYLAANSPYRNAGTTNINPALLAELRKRTTYPPILISNTTIVADTSLSPQAQRDIDIPDLGYQMEPIDYILNGVVVSNATLTLTNGVSIGIDSRATNYGIRLDSGGALTSDSGSPLAMNRIVRTHNIQELTAGTNTFPSIADTWPTPSNPTSARFRFTDFPSLAGNDRLFYQGHAEGSLTTIILRDCEVRGGWFHWSPFNNGMSLGLTNNLFERVKTEWWEYLPATLNVFNTLFYQGSLSNVKDGASTWNLYLNLFDKTTINNPGVQVSVNNCNAYITNFSRLASPGPNDVILTNDIAYQTNSLGGWYIPTNITQLFNAPCYYASDLGLYHFTTSTNNVTETNSLADISYHRVALDANNQPRDSDSDGYPDWYEDANGSGTVNSGETDPNSASDMGLRVIITRPRAGSPIP